MTTPPPASDDAGPGVALMLRPRPWKMAGFCALSLALAVPGVLMAREGRGAGWLVGGLFGLSAAAFAAMLLPGAASLVIDREGFTIRSLFRSHRFAWTEAGPFHPVPVGGRMLVGFEVAGPHGAGAMAGLGRVLSGAPAALPDTYGLTPQALADLMNEARRRACAATGQG